MEMPDISAETGTEMIFYLYTGHVRESANFQVGPVLFGGLDPDPFWIRIRSVADPDPLLCL
jgi:hypothetical protein